MKSALYKLGMILVIAALLVGCAPAATPAPAEPAAPAAPAAPAEPTAAPAAVEPTAAPAPVEEVKPFKVAIVMPSTVSDYAFSQSMFEGLKAMQEKMGGPEKFEIAYSESLFKVPDAAAAIRDYASQGFDLVIAHGSQYGTSLAQIAPEFPETAFAWGTAQDTFQKDGISNVFAYQAESQEGGYVFGVLAAQLSKTGKLGVNGPVEAGDAKLYVDGFKAGAANAGKPAEVNVTYTGSFSRFAHGCCG